MVKRCSFRVQWSVQISFDLPASIFADDGLFADTSEPAIRFHSIQGRGMSSRRKSLDLLERQLRLVEDASGSHE
jgi:hypothetical protein